MDSEAHEQPSSTTSQTHDSPSLPPTSLQPGGVLYHYTAPVPIPPRYQYQSTHHPHRQRYGTNSVAAPSFSNYPFGSPYFLHYGPGPAPPTLSIVQTPLQSHSDPQSPGYPQHNPPNSNHSYGSPMPYSAAPPVRSFPPQSAQHGNKPHHHIRQVEGRPINSRQSIMLEQQSDQPPLVSNPAGQGNVDSGQLPISVFSRQYSNLAYPHGYSPSLFQGTSHSPYQQPYGQYSVPFYGQTSQDDPSGSWWYATYTAGPGPSANMFYRPPHALRTSPSPLASPVAPEIGAVRPVQNHRRRTSPLRTPGFGSHQPGRTPFSSSLGVEVNGAHMRSSPGPQSRKSWHPNPPTSRSQWVMWVGNVPSDATNEELVTFFSRQKRGDVSPQHEQSGVLTVFIIPRSNCAFVNFDSEERLERAIRQFNGRPLRVNGARTMKLVCRIRRPDDDLRAGVGGQRGIGMHARWVEKKRRSSISPSLLMRGPSDAANRRIPTPIVTSGILKSVRTVGSEHDTSIPNLEPPSTSGSSTSTSSSFLTKNFPKRYFILKSLSESHLIVSVDLGTWATQRHNEPILDQAYRTSEDVYLVFSANKSGAFFGYARMDGPISSDTSGTPHVSEASRPDCGTYPERTDATATSPERQPPGESRLGQLSPFPLSPAGRQVDVSPAIVTAQEERRRLNDGDNKESFQPGSEAKEGGAQDMTIPFVGSSTAASAELADKLPHHISAVNQSDLDGQPEAPPAASESPVWTGPGDETTPRQPEGASYDVRYHVSQGWSTQDGAGLTGRETAECRASKLELEKLGRSFRVHWIRTERISFQTTKHIRNPWNHDKEVKVSRDGTELEPSIGAALLAEWDKQYPRDDEAVNSG